MSRVGNKPVELPKGVEVKISGNIVNVKGPKGQLEQEVRPEVTVNNEEGKLTFVPCSQASEMRALQGLYRSLLNNMVVGVSEGFKKVLIITGTGYKAAMQGKKLTLNLGFSHQVDFDLPKEITAIVEGTNKIILESYDKQMLGQLCANIRKLRPPEPYKGKGIAFEGEIIRRKAGKVSK